VSRRSAAGAVANSITDVEGVRVAHGGPGLTVVLPYPRSVARRKVWGAYRSEGRVGEVSGLHVLRDFGVLSSPILLCPHAWFGSLYDSLIEDSFRRDPELSIDAGWPPLVFGLPAQPAQALAEPPAPASVRSLLDGAGARFATGGGSQPAGIGSASKRTPAGHLVGVLAVCIGEVQIAILATDAPLSPLSLGRLAEQALRGLQTETGAAALAFTTAQGLQGAFDKKRNETRRRQAPSEERSALGRAATAAVCDSVLSARS